MLQISYGLLALAITQSLAYCVRIQVGNWSKLSIVILLLSVIVNLIATFLPNLFCELWGFELSKVKAVSFWMWFCLGAGGSIGFLS